jgi:hypothetical protein
MDLLHVFVDEYGDAHLDTSKTGVSSAYIIAAVCVRAANLDEARLAAEAIRKRHFQSGEMKSSVVAGNDGRRLHILRDLSNIPGFVISYCARKGGIDSSSGLAYKKSFIKFFAKRLYDRIILCADEFRILIDEHGTPEFQTELRTHFEKTYRPDLFARATFSFGDSKTDVLLQTADFYAGTLARIYDEKKLSDRAEELRGVLRDSVATTVWPRSREGAFIPLEEHVSANDERIRRHCVKRAEAYLLSLGQQPDDPDDRARATFVDTLIAHHTWGDPGTFLPTHMLKREIAATLGEPISDHRFRSAIVAKVRDADVVISSCSKGYRLPSSASDVREFAHFANSIIPAMVARVEKARRGIREATQGDVDILGDANLSELRAIVDTVA